MIRPLQNVKILPPPCGKQMSFVIGTGRCGFKSMTALLSRFQPKAIADYEFRRIAWDDPTEGGLYHTFVRIYGLMALYKDVEVVVSIAHYFLPYVNSILEMYPDAKFVCLKRNKEDTIPSLVKQAKTRNFWTRTDSKHWLPTDTRGKFYKTFPSFDAPREAAAGMYYDYYYDLAATIGWTHPDNFLLVNMEDVFNDKQTQWDTLRFLGIEHPKVKLGIRK